MSENPAPTAAKFGARERPRALSFLQVVEASALPPRAVSGSELKAEIEAERAGEPFLVYRDGVGDRRLHRLEGGPSHVTVGRRPSCGISLSWDEEVSRLHAALERVGDDWTLVDDGLSRNGSFVNGERVSGRRRLRDGDALRVGGTVMTFRAPDQGRSKPTALGDEPLTAASLSATQRRILVALCRPFRDSTPFATPSTNQQIAEEVHLSVDAVKAHLRTLFEKFDVEHLPQNQKRTRLVERAFLSGLVSDRDL